MINGLLSDARHAARRIAREPAFSLVVVAILALGIGWSTAIFSVLDTALVRPLPYASPEQLVHLWERREGSAMTRGELSEPELADLRGLTAVFSDIAAYRASVARIGLGENTERIDAVRVTADFFPLLRVSPLRGRVLGASDQFAASTPTAIVSFDTWKTRFGGDPTVVGRVVNVDGAPTMIVGVLPETFHFALAANAQIWLPIRPTNQSGDRSNRWLRVIARMRPETSIEQAGREFDVVVRRLAQEHAETTKGRRGTVVPLRQEFVGSNQNVLFALFVGVVALLLTGCTNVAGLLVSRVGGRAPEIAVRRALGAGDRQILSQILIENLMLAICGGALGIVVAYGALRILLAQIPGGMIASFPFVAATQIDGRAIALAVAIAVTIGLVCGAAPVIWALRQSPAVLLRSGSRGVASRSRWRLVLVANQLAFTFALVCCSSLLGRSLGALRQADLGFRSDRMLTFSVAVDEKRFPSAASRASLFLDIERRLKADPDIESVAIGTDLPLEFGSAGSFTLSGDGGGARAPYARFRFVNPGYIEAMGIRVQDGRTFVRSDTSPASGAVVTTAFMREYRERGARIGAVIDVSGQINAPIVGVVDDVRLALDQNPEPIVYFPLGWEFFGSMRFAVRTRGDGASVIARVRQIIAAVDPQLTPTSVRSMQQAIDGSPAIFTRRFPMLVTAAFSVVALTLAAVGLFGLVAYSIVQRTREFGIRIALGAPSASVVTLSLRDALQATGIGIAAGVLIVLAVGRAMSGVLYGVPATDLTSVGVTVAVVTLTAIAAALVPVIRVVRISPATVLRHG